MNEKEIIFFDESKQMIQNKPNKIEKKVSIKTKDTDEEKEKKSQKIK
jgi:hypothetical protein